MSTHFQSGQQLSGSSNHNLIGHRIDDGRLELMSVLGLGAYGVVYLARDLNSPDLRHPRLYAVKALNKIGLDARQKSFQRREIALHSLASAHPSIVTLHAVIESAACVFVILDYCPDGDLFGMITEKQKYLGKTEAIKSVFTQIIEAVQFCHRLGISHRDLKPENILCKKNGNEVVLADFGLATAEQTSSDFGCGSTFYMSPECQGGLFQKLESYSTFHNDIWSLGVILVNLTCGRNPWKQACPTDDTFRAYLANPDFLRSILPISEPCNALLKRIFTLNPLARITLSELKSELSKIDNFNMTVLELSRSTKATREAARAWRQDVPISPNPSPKMVPSAGRHSSSWRNPLAKKSKKHLPRQQQLNDKDRRAVIKGHSSVSGQARSAQPKTPDDPPAINSVVTPPSSHRKSPLAHLPPQVQTPRTWKQFHSPSAVLNNLRGSDCHSRNGSLGSKQVSAPRDQHPTPRGVLDESLVEILGRSLRDDHSSPDSGYCASSDSPMVGGVEQLKKHRLAGGGGGLSGLICPRKSLLMSPATNNSRGTSDKATKRTLIKPLGFSRPNAPSPIILKSCTPESSHSSSISIITRALNTPGNKKQSVLGFLPSTPPSSASPSSSTFGFIKKPTRFFQSVLQNPELPPTPSTPNHPSGLSPTLSSSNNRPIRPKVSRLPNLNHQHHQKLSLQQEKQSFCVFGSSDEDEDDFKTDVIDCQRSTEEEREEDDENNYQSSYPAYAEWVKRTCSPTSSTSSRLLGI